MSKLHEQYKQYGFLRLVSRIFKSVLRRIGIIYETLYYFEKNLDLEDIHKRLSLIDYSDIKLLTMDDFSKCEFLDENKIRLYRDRLDSGEYEVFGIFRDAKLVYYSWMSFENIGLPNGFSEKIPLADNEALLEDSFCDPKYRGRGFHGKVNMLRLKRLLEKGKNKAVVIVLKGNIPAIKVQVNSGFKIIKKIILIQLFSKKRIKYLPIYD